MAGAIPPYPTMSKEARRYKARWGRCITTGGAVGLFISMLRWKAPETSNGIPPVTAAR